MGIPRVRAPTTKGSRGSRGTRPGSPLGMTIVEVILALFLPPVAVFLKRGISREFCITLVLTLLGHVPGVIYALVVLTRES